MAAYRYARHTLVLVAAAAAASWSAASTTRAPGSQAVPSDSTRAAHMQGHFSQAMVVHDAVIRGDLEGVRAPARWLAEHDAPASLPAGSSPYVAAMRQAAGRTAAATSIAEAALGAAEMLLTCGECHRAVGTMPSAAPTQGPRVGGVVGHMLAHQQSVDQMLHGLVVPSGTSWRAGARALAGDPLRRPALPDDPGLTPVLMASERWIHDVARQAAQVEDGRARAVFYGRIIARCADCHALHRRVWGPARR